MAAPPLHASSTLSSYNGSQSKPQESMSQPYGHHTFISSQPSSAHSSYYEYQLSSHPQSPQASAGTTASSISNHDSVFSFPPKSPMDSYAASTYSVTSHSLKHGDPRKESMATATSELDMISTNEKPAYPPSAMSRDPEKRVLSPASPRRSENRNSYPHRDVEQGLYGAQDEPEAVDLQSKALTIIFYLSFLSPLITFLALFWTAIALLISAFLLPLRALKVSSPTLHSLLLPPLRLQLSFIYSHHTHPAIECRTGSAILVHLLSPIFSFAFAIASWIIALFWFFSAVLGDPAGSDGHNDGTAAVLWIRNKWEAWLIKGLVI